MGSASRSLYFFAAAALAYVQPLHADNLLNNPGFESGKSEWQACLPTDNKQAMVEWNVARSNPRNGGACAVLKSGEPVRWGISYRKSLIVTPGERYQIAGWVRFTNDDRNIGKEPLAYIRLLLRQPPGVALAANNQGHLHVGLTGDVARSRSVNNLRTEKLPEEWTQVKAVIEIPPGIGLVGIQPITDDFVGTAYWDDFSFEPVPPGTPLSRILE
jgi:hypothetical protein